MSAPAIDDRGMWRWGWVVLFALSACDEPPGLASQDVCESLCSCVYGLPGQIDACVAQCEQAVPDPTPTCRACADDSTCAEVLDCVDVCTTPPPQEIP
jgi:hypothetical protein